MTKCVGKFADRWNYYPDSIAPPVANLITVRILLILLCRYPIWVVELIDIERQFLQRMFESGEELYIKLPDGYENWYPWDVVLWLDVLIYSTKQAIYCFFKMFAKKVMKGCSVLVFCI